MGRDFASLRLVYCRLCPEACQAQGAIDAYIGWEMRMFVGEDGIIPGKASQSSTEDSGIASRAVDGEPHQHYLCKSCTYTGDSNKPWWRLDFDTIQAVSQVHVWNRADCCGDRLNGVEVRVDNTMCGTLDSSASVQIVDCGNALGSFVQLQKPTSGHLSLCEVKVYFLG